MAGRKEGASQNQKARIIQTAVELLLKKGSSTATSTTDICSAAGLTRPTLYHYFGSKRNLLLSVHMDHMEKTLKPYLEAALSIEEPLERLRYMVRTFTKEIVCKHPELRVIIHDSLTMKDQHFREVKGAWKEHYVLLRDTIGRLQSRGDLKTRIEPSWAALFVLGMLTWVLFWLDYGRTGDIDRLTDQGLELVLHGLGLGPAAPGQERRSA